MSEIGSAGSIVQSGTRLFLVGGSSGLDTSALIEAAVQQRLREALTIDVKIETNNVRSAALTTLQELGGDVQVALTALRGAFGLSSTDGAIFEAKAGTLTSDTAIDPSSLVSVTIDETAPTGSNEIIVQQKAQVHRIASDTTTDPAVAFGLTGTFRLRLAGEGIRDIDIVATDTLQDIADKINVETDSTKVQASIIKISETDFQLVLSGTETGLNLKRDVISGDDILQSIGVLDGVSAFKNVLQVEQDSIIEYNGITITRDSNTIDDLITGIGIEILGADPATTLTLDVGNDNAGVKASIENFVTAYNTFRDFVLQNQVVASDGSVSDETALFGDNLLEGLNTSLQRLFGINFTATGGAETLGEIGLELDANNQIIIDESVLDDAIINNFDVVRALFQSQYSDDNAEFNVLRNDSQIQSLNFALDITYSGGAITNVAVGGDNTLFDISGSSITGKIGTIYQGLVFAYVGTASTTVNIGFEQGFADLGVNVLEGYVSVVGGLIQGEKLSLDNQNDNLSGRATRVRERAEDFRERLIDQYARFEAQLSRAKSIIAQLRAILGIDNNDN